MCRIALYTSTGDRHSLRELLKCFRLGSTNDFVLDSYRRGHRVHGHGWGIAYVYELFNAMGFMLYKTSLPISANIISSLPIPRYFDWILMILHSRLTSKEPIDLLNTHPHYFNRPGEISIWLVHNGSVDKQIIAKELGMPQLINKYSDSYFLTQFIGKNLIEPTKESVIDTIKSVIELNIVKSALNIAAIVLDENNKRAIGLAVNYVDEKAMDMFNYYRLYKMDIESNLVIIASSTVALYMNKFSKFDIKPLDNKTIVFIHPDKGGIDVEIYKLK